MSFQENWLNRNKTNEPRNDKQIDASFLLKSEKQYKMFQEERK